MHTPLLRLRSDDQLLALFRGGNDDAFRVIHDRYRQRLFAYTRQMLPGSTQDAEDALQDVFVRAYSGLRTNRRQLALRPWLYRVAHNRCVDELRRPLPPPPEELHQCALPAHDPATRAEQRESLQRLIADLRRLPDHQRSALLMRELSGMTYAEVAAAMDVSVPAVKSLLVRARIGLALAIEARDTACVKIRDNITLAHDRGVRPSGNVRRHLADCEGCREFRAAVRGSRRQFAALLPAFGPVGVLANLLGIGGGGAAGGGAGAAATGGATASTGAMVGGGTAASVGTFTVGATHVATLIAAAVVTAGGAVAIQHTIAPVHRQHAVHAEATMAAPVAPTAPATAPAAYAAEPSATPASPSTRSPSGAQPGGTKQATGGSSATDAKATGSTSVSGGDNVVPTATVAGGATSSTTSATAGATPTGTTGTASTGAGGTTSSTGTTGSTGSTGSSSQAGSGTGAGTGTGTGASSASGTGNPSATGAGAGTPSGTTPGATQGTPTGT